MKTTKRLFALLLVLEMLAICLPPITAQADTKYYDSYFNYTVSVGGIATLTSVRNKSLSSAKIPAAIDYGSYQVGNIGANAFQNCKSLTSVTIPKSVSTIGSSAFSGCTKLTSVSIQGGISIIGSGAFSGCTKLTSVSIQGGGGISLIGSGVFSGCTSLTSVPSGISQITSSMFSNCTSLTSASIPYGSTSIGSSAFAGCTSLASATIPNSVTSIESSAFSGCTSLTSVTIPNSVTSIGEYAFQGCTSLTSVTIPNSVTSIESSAFSGCTSLTSVTIPDSVTSIGEYAFQGCTSLTSVTIPDSVTSIGADAFSACDQLETIYYKGDQLKWTAINKDTSLSNVDIKYLRTITFKGRDGSILQSGTCCLGDVVNMNIPELKKCEWDNSNIYVFSGWDIPFSEICNGDAIYTAIYETHSVNSALIECSMPNAVALDQIHPVVTCYGVPLTRGEDYTVELSNHTAVGNNAKITINGLRAFKGWNTSFNFFVVKTDISNATISVADCTFNGTPQKPTPTVKWNGITLKKGTDYIANYINNVQAGTATVQILGIGNNTGFAEKTFKISYSTYKTVSFNTSSTSISLRDQGLEIDLGDPLLCGYTLYKDGLYISSYTASPQSISEISRYITLYQSDFSKGTGTYTLEVYVQGYTYVVQGGKYKPVASGAKTWNAFTITVSAPYTTTTPTKLTALEPQIIGVRTLYLGVSANSNANLFPQTWATSDSAVATVENGIVTLHKAGNATITVTIGGLQARWAITTEGLNINKNSKLHYDATSDTVTIVYGNELLTEGTDYTVTTQTNEGVVTVSVQGCNLFSGTILRRFDASTGELLSIPGDIDGNESVTQDDAVYLLLNTMFGEAFYPLNGAEGDIDCNGSVDQEDAVYLLLHTMFGESFYPLNTPALPAKAKE